jgi:hypothetical protein
MTAAQCYEKTQVTVAFVYSSPTGSAGPGGVLLGQVPEQLQDAPLRRLLRRDPSGQDRPSETRGRVPVRGALYELARTAAGRSKPRKASGVRKAVISWICAPRRVSTSTARGMKACVLSSQA